VYLHCIHRVYTDIPCECMCMFVYAYVCVYLHLIHIAAASGWDVRISAQHHQVGVVVASVYPKPIVPRHQ